MGCHSIERKGISKPAFVSWLGGLLSTKCGIKGMLLYMQGESIQTILKIILLAILKKMLKEEWRARSTDVTRYQTECSAVIGELIQPCSFFFFFINVKWVVLLALCLVHICSVSVVAVLTLKLLLLYSVLC